MKILLIRHGRSEGDILNLHEGRADYSLTEAGELQAKELASYVKKTFNITKIFTSPLRRALKTAEIISNECNIPFTSEKDLMEFNNGLLAGCTREFANEKYPEIKLPEDQSLYEMECLNQFLNRVRFAFGKIISTCKDEDTVAIITHGGVINMLYKVMIGLPACGNEIFCTEDTGLHVWNFKDNKLYIEKSNSTEHINEEIRRTVENEKKLNVAYFAGGCFWCITPIFKMYKAKKSLCGYSGGMEVNPVYEDVKKQKTGHRETIAVEYDPALVTFEKLLQIYLANVDPFDGEGQFIDKGFSYTLAVYYTTIEEKEITEKAIHELEEKSGKKVFIAVEPLKNFYEAETYHQDYYLKNPEAFEKELIESGRKKA